MRAHSLRLAHSNLHLKNQIGSYLGKQRVHAQRSEKPTNEKAGNAKKRTRTEATAFMDSSELVFVDDSGTPYRLIQNEPTPAPIKPTFSTKDQDDANTLTQITEDLACQILYTLVAVSSYATIHYYYIIIVRIDLQYTCYLVPVLKIQITSIFVYVPYL